jgi:hypothetical protein
MFSGSAHNKENGMQSCHRLMLTAGIATLLIAAMNIVLVAQEGRQLYLLRGFAANNAFPFKVESALMAIDEQKSLAVRVVGLVDQAEGSNSIVSDHDRRLITIGIGDETFGTKRLVVVPMDAPSAPRTLPIAFRPDFFCGRPNGPVYACAIGVVPPEGRLWGVDLTSATLPNSASLLQWDDYRFVQTEGSWSPGDLNPGIDLYPKNGRLLFRRNVDTADLGIPSPPNLESSVKDRLVLDISNDDMFVIGRYGPATSPGPGVAETHTFYIYDKKTAAWHNVKIEGGGVSIRGFGPWVAAARADRKRAIGVSESDPRAEPVSPGAVFRNRILNPKVRERNQTPLETLFQNVPYYFPGELYLYNVRSRQKYTIQTGQGDSEILLVADDTVYYRVNDTLYKARIEQSVVGSPVKILTDDSVQLAHWAFLGPVLAQ